MALENYTKIDNEEKLTENLKEYIEGFKNEEKDVAEGIIKGLDENQLTGFIKKSFIDGDNGWKTYSEMRSNEFYPFIVQASIDLLSNKLNAKKINESGCEDDENGKTLDEWLKSTGGIDNKYGGGTFKIVKMVQHVLGINEDGKAGPQFFAKVCSVLSGESISDFKVKGYDIGQDYPYGFLDKIKNKEYELPDGFELREFKESSDGKEFANIYRNGIYSNYYLEVDSDGNTQIYKGLKCNEDVDGKMTITDNKIIFEKGNFYNYEAGNNEGDLKIVIAEKYSLFGIQKCLDNDDTYVYRVKKGNSYCGYIMKKKGENPEFIKGDSGTGDVNLSEKDVYIGGNSEINKKKLRYLE